MIYVQQLLITTPVVLPVGDVDEVRARAVGLGVIGSQVHLRLLIGLHVGTDLVKLCILLVEEAAVGLHLRLRLDGVKDGLVVCRLLRLGHPNFASALAMAKPTRIRPAPSASSSSMAASSSSGSSSSMAASYSSGYGESGGRPTVIRASHLDSPYLL